MVAVPRSGLEARTHAGRKASAAFVRLQRREPLENVDELVLLRVSVSKRGNGAWCKTRKVDAKVRQTKHIAQRALLSALHAGCKGLRIVGWLGPGRHVGGGDGR